MTTTLPAPESDGATATALTVGTHLLTGRYRVESADGRWWWSDEVYRMHGYEPGDVEPGAETLLSRLHPDERARAAHEARVQAAPGPFASAHRVVDARGRTRTLLFTGQSRPGRDGRPDQTVGYVIDVTPVQREAVDRDVRRALDNALVSATAVERAKGVLMAVHGVDDRGAGRMLAEAAAAAGGTVQEAAGQLMAALSNGEGFGAGPAESVREALAAVRPSPRPHVHEPQLARRRIA